MLWSRSASDEDDPDVLGHREQHLPDVLGLLLMAVGREARQRDPSTAGRPLTELLPTSVRVYSVSSGRRAGARPGSRCRAELGEDLGRRDRGMTYGSPLALLAPARRRRGRGAVDARVRPGCSSRIADAGGSGRFEVGAHRSIFAMAGAARAAARRASLVLVRGVVLAIRSKDTLSRSRLDEARPPPRHARPMGSDRRAR
jgi:hypothetical protein